MRPIVFNDELVREIHQGIDMTFSNMFGVKPIPGSYTITDANAFQGEISGIIALVQDTPTKALEGTLVLTFPAETIFSMLAKIYNRQFTAVDKNVKSGVGELTNIVFGIFKANLNRNGFSFQMALPNVLHGDTQVASALPAGQTLTIPYKCAVGSFTVSVVSVPRATNPRIAS